MRQRLLALDEQRVGEIIEGASTAVAPRGLAAWPIVIIAPGADVMALTPGALERTIFPGKIQTSWFI